MAFQPETANYDAGVYQLELTDPVQGGVGGVSNEPLLNLANRTAWLYQQLNLVLSGTFIPPTVAPLLSPPLTGTPTTPTPPLGDSSLKIANTAFVQGSIAGVLLLNIAGGTNVSLTAIQAGNGTFVFGGALTASISVIVPNTPGKWVVANNTTGGFAITVKTAAGTGIVVSQFKSQSLACDGTNVFLASNDFANIALTGVPTAPTAAPGTNTTQVSTTAFVAAAVSAVTSGYALLAGSASQVFSVAKGTAATNAAALSQVQNGSRVIGLVAQNNATSPLTKFDVSASSVTLRESSTGIAYTVTSLAQVTITNDTGLAGPIANGRDGAGALAASQWVRLFYIYNPTTATLATISSAGSPTAGPNLPAGYTAWAYIGSIYWNGSSNFAQGNMRGARWQYSSSVIAINGGTSTGLVAVPIPTLVPPECGWFELFFQQLACTSGSGGGYSVNCQITTQASSIFNIGFGGIGTASQLYSFSGPSKQITNFGQSFAYALTVSGSSPTVTIYVTGYQLPNGGE